MSEMVVVLVSGGIDSVTALYQSHSIQTVAAAISFDYGSKHNSREIPFALLHCNRLNIPHYTIRLDFINDLFKSDLLRSGGEVPKGHYNDLSMKSTVVPFRNGIMLSIAAGIAESIGANAVVIAAHSGDHAIYPDCRSAFMSAIGDAIRLGTYSSIKILCPFLSANKQQIVRCGDELGLLYSDTWSCYTGEEFHCGTCGACVERKEAFILANLHDPTTYITAPPAHFS